ncbi:serine/threonine protein kinase, partial [Oculatella sp. LEGE 06141]|uniref:hypothetical protein n=1 Tax=Oculatella sp. LEGE 06141 TaxID=1828648 RepID=UPI0019E83C9A|nr:serine/threonine protein kinase [Oculatella sp. LEGE 06141]
TITPTPSPSPTEQVTEYNQQIEELAPGRAIRVEGRLRPNETVNYVVSGEEGQTLTASLQGEGVLLTVLAEDREPVRDDSIRVQSWQGPFDYTGDYFIQLRPVQGLSTESNYNLNLSLEAAPEPTPTITPTPTPTTVEPEIDIEQLNFPAGAEGTTVSDQASNAVIKRYLINAQAGQILSVEAAEGAVTLDIRYPNGQLVEDASGLVQWQAQLPTSGDYIVDVIATQPTDYTLDVSVRTPE